MHLCECVDIKIPVETRVDVSSSATTSVSYPAVNAHDLSEYSPLFCCISKPVRRVKAAAMRAVEAGRLRTFAGALAIGVETARG